jgi:hypothetical protein
MLKEVDRRRLLTKLELVSSYKKKSLNYHSKQLSMLKEVERRRLLTKVELVSSLK